MHKVTSARAVHNETLTLALLPCAQMHAAANKLFIVPLPDYMQHDDECLHKTLYTTYDPYL